jgi:hypothetical protein
MSYIRIGSGSGKIREAFVKENEEFQCFEELNVFSKGLRFSSGARK